MDSIRQQKLHALTNFRRCHHPLNGAFQILLSVSLFSLVFLSYPSSWSPTTNFRKSFNPLLTSFISSYLSFEDNRNLMFLLCNAILVIVTGGFGYFRVSSNAAEDIHGEYLAWSEAHHPSVPVEDKEVIVQSIVLAKYGLTDIEVEDGQDEEEEAAAIDDGADQENHYRQHHLYQPYHHRQNRPHHRQRQLPVQVEEEENHRLQQQKQDERGGLVVIEESDERFDNFIKQVREAMRMEAKQLLLTA